MELMDLLSQTSEWLKGTGDDADIVVSSRVRLARNLYKLPFSHWANEEEKKQVLNEVKPIILGHDLMKNGMFYIINELENIERNFLIERHLMSREHAKDDPYKGIVIKENETLSVMINEEDHLRLQTIKSGFNLDGAWDMISGLDKEIGNELEYAFSDEWGYLTACPTNTGTGIRASVMLHLPGLVMTEQIEKILQVISKLSLTVRGFYGEGSEARGNFFQISNQVTLGNSEVEIIDNLKRVIRQIIGQEKQSRVKQLNNNRQILEDKIWRSYGILNNAKVISSQETIDLLSSVRLGVELGIVEEVDRRLINKLFMLIQPAHLQKISGKKLNVKERDFERAELIRDRLNSS